MVTIPNGFVDPQGTWRFPSNNKYIEPQKIVFSESQAAFALREAWKRIYGQYPSDNSLAILWSQVALETGRFKRQFMNYNYGNIKKKHAGEKRDSKGNVIYHFNDDGHYWTMFGCSEVIKGKEVWFDPPAHETMFRAYKTAEDGAEDYIKLVSQKTRYKKAWQKIIEGDPAGYSHELKIAGYYTANEERYTKAVVSLTNEFLRRKKELLSWEPPIEPVTIDDEDIENAPDTDPSPPPSVEEKLDSDPLPITNPDPEPELKTEPAPPLDFLIETDEDKAIANKPTVIKRGGIMLAVLIALGTIATWFSNCLGC